MSVGIKYRNKKTGEIYRWLAAGNDCTNSRVGLPVAIYCPDENEHMIFVREQYEFEDKFEEVTG